MMTNCRCGSLRFCIPLLAGIVTCSAPARATVTVTIGTVVESVTGGPDAGAYAGYFTENNLMSDVKMDIDGYYMDSIHGPGAGPTLNPGAGRVYLNWAGFPAGWFFQIYGHLEDPDFTVDGQQYEAAGADWITPRMFAGQNGATFDIDIDADPIHTHADPIDPVSEPGSVALLATLLAALAWRVRQAQRRRLEPR